VSLPRQSTTSWADYIDRLEQELSELREKIRLYEAVIDNFPGGILLTDKNLDVVLCNQQQRDLLEYPPALFFKRMPSLQELFRYNAQRGEYGPGDIEAIIDYKMEQVRKRVPHVFERTRPNGTVVEVRGMPLTEGGFVTSYTDVTENRRNAALIANLAMHDTLTGLGNRNNFKSRFEQAAARAKRGEGFAIHYIDLDHFKPINDRFGHEAGDKILVEVARRIKHTIRETDDAVRLGGDEFVVLQSDVSSFSGARELANRLMRVITETYVVDGAMLEVGACIGVALSTRDCMSMDEMLRKADRALYASKNGGRGTYQVALCAMADKCPLHKGSCEC